MTLTQAVTLAIALLGAVLGVINTWHALDKNRVKLKVVPKIAMTLGRSGSAVGFCIEITNLSAFAVTVDEAGVHFRGTEARGQ